jgi:hypothetical protein
VDTTIFICSLTTAGIFNANNLYFLSYPWCRTKSRWRSIDAHYQDGAGSVSLRFQFKRGEFIKKIQWFTNVEILKLTVGHMNVTINRKTRKPEPQNETNEFHQAQQSLQVAGYQYWFDTPRNTSSDFWKGLQPIWTVFPVRTRTAGGLPVLIAITSQIPSGKVFPPDYKVYL